MASEKKDNQKTESSLDLNLVSSESMGVEKDGSHEEEAPSPLDPTSMKVLQAIGEKQFRMRELCVETKKYGLSTADTQFALGDLCERGLAKIASNGFDCLYVLTRVGRDLFSENRRS